MTGVKNTMIQLAEKTFFGKNKDTSGVVGRTPQRPSCRLGKGVRGSMGRMASSFSSLSKKKEQVAVSNEVPSNPCVGSRRSSGSQSPDLGDMWRYGCLKSPDWISSCSATETSLGCDVCEHNNECRALEVIGQDRSSEVEALFLEDWELGRVALSCHTTMDLLSVKGRDVVSDKKEGV